LRTFFLFVLLNSLLRNPLLALIAVGAVLYFVEARYRGRYFNPGKVFYKKSTIRELQRRVQVNPHDVEARNDLGRLLVEEGRDGEAREQLEAAIRRMSESPETHYYLGVSQLRTGSAEQGVANIEKALEIKPAFLYGEPHVALARHFLDRRDYQRAAEQAEAAVKTNTSSVEGWFLLGSARQGLGRTESAREAYRNAEEAFTQLPKYLRMANRSWRSRARRAAKSLN